MVYEVLPSKVTYHPFNNEDVKIVCKAHCGIALLFICRQTNAEIEPFLRSQLIAMKNDPIRVIATFGAIMAPHFMSSLDCLLLCDIGSC